MAESGSEIREAIEETRAEVAETIGALGHKADVRNRLGETAKKGNQAKEQLAEYASHAKSQAKSKASELREQAAEQIPDRVGPAIGSAVDQARGAAATAARGSRRRWAVGMTFVLAVVAVLMARRRRAER